MAEVSTDHPDQSITRIPKSRFQSLSSKRGFYGLNQNGVAENSRSAMESAIVSSAGSTANSSTDRTRLTPLNTHQPISEKTAETSTAKSFLRRFVFRRSTREKKKGKVAGEGDYSQGKVVADVEPVSTIALGTTTGFVDKPHLPTTTTANGRSVPTHSVLRQNNPSGLLRSASFSINNTAKGKYNENSGLKRSASVSLSSRSDGYNNTRYRPKQNSITELEELAKVDGDENIDDLCSNAMAGYSPKLLTNGGVNRVGKSTHKRMNEDICLNEMKKTSSTTTLSSDTKEPKPNQIPAVYTQHCSYSPSSQVYTQRHLKQDISLGGAVKLASKTKTKTKGSKPTSANKGKHSNAKCDFTYYNHAMVPEELADMKMNNNLDQKGIGLNKNKKGVAALQRDSRNGNVHSTYSCPSDITNTITTGRPKSAVLVGEFSQSAKKSGITRPHSMPPSDMDYSLTSECRDSKTGKMKSAIMSYKGEHSKTLRSQLAYRQLSSVSHDTETIMSSEDKQCVQSPDLLAIPEAAYKGEHSRTLRSTMQQRFQLSKLKPKEKESGLDKSAMKQSHSNTATKHTSQVSIDDQTYDNVKSFTGVPKKDHGKERLSQKDHGKESLIPRSSGKGQTDNKLKTGIPMKKEIIEFTSDHLHTYGMSPTGTTNKAPEHSGTQNAMLHGNQRKSDTTVRITNNSRCKITGASESTGKQVNKESDGLDVESLTKTGFKKVTSSPKKSDKSSPLKSDTLSPGKLKQGSAKSGIPTFRKQNSFRDRGADKVNENTATKIEKNEEFINQSKTEKPKSAKQPQIKMERPKSDSFAKETKDVDLKRGSSVRRSLGETDYKSMQRKRSSAGIKGQRSSTGIKGQSSMSKSQPSVKQIETQNNKVTQSASHSKLPLPKMTMSPRKTSINTSPVKAGQINNQRHQKSSASNKGVYENKNRSERHISDKTAHSLQQGAQPIKDLLGADVCVKRLEEVEKTCNNEEGVHTIENRLTENTALTPSKLCVHTRMSAHLNCVTSGNKELPQLIERFAQPSSVGVAAQKGIDDDNDICDNMRDQVRPTSVKRAIEERVTTVQRGETKPTVNIECHNDRIMYSTNTLIQQENTITHKKTPVPRADRAEHLRAGQNVYSLDSSKLTEENKESTDCGSSDAGESTRLPANEMKEHSVDTNIKPLEHAKSINLNYNVGDSSPLSSEDKLCDFYSASQSMDNISFNFDCRGGENKTVQMANRNHTKAIDKSLEVKNCIANTRTLETERTLEEFESARSVKNNVKNSLEEDSLKGKIATATDYTKTGVELRNTEPTLSEHSESDSIICANYNIKSSMVTKRENSSREGSYPVIHTTLCLAGSEERNKIPQRILVTDKTLSGDAANTSKVGNEKELVGSSLLHGLQDKVIVTADKRRNDNNVRKTSDWTRSGCDEEIKRSPGTYRTIISVSPRLKSEIPTPVRKHSKSTSKISGRTVSPAVHNVSALEQIDANPHTSEYKLSIRNTHVPRQTSCKFTSQNSCVDDFVDVTHVNQSKESRQKTDMHTVGQLSGVNIQPEMSISEQSTSSERCRTTVTKTGQTDIELTESCSDHERLQTEVVKRSSENILSSSECRQKCEESVTITLPTNDQTFGCTQELPSSGEPVTEKSISTQDEMCVLPLQITSPRKQENNFPHLSYAGRSVSSPVLSSTPDVKSRLTTHLSTRSLGNPDLKLKRSRAVSCLREDNLQNNEAWSEDKKMEQSNDTLDELSEFVDSTDQLCELVPNEFYSESEKMNAMDCDTDSVHSVNTDEEEDVVEGNQRQPVKVKSNTERVHTVRFASTPIIRIYNDRGRDWTPSEDSDWSDYDNDDSDDSLKDIESFIEEMDESGCNEGRYVPLCNRMDFSVPLQQEDRKIESCKRNGSVEFTTGNGDRMVAHTDQGDDTTLCDSVVGVPYVTRNMGEQSDKYSQEIAKQQIGLDMLNTNKSHCGMTENNAATDCVQSGVDTGYDQRRGRDSKSVIRQDCAAHNPSVTAMGIEPQSPNRPQVKLTEKSSVIDSHSFVAQTRTPKQAWTWTNIDVASLNHTKDSQNIREKSNLKNGEKLSSGDKELERDCAKVVGAGEQSEGLLKPCRNTGSIVSLTGERKQKPDLCTVNGLCTTAITEASPNTDWHSATREHTKKSSTTPLPTQHSSSDTQFTAQLSTQFDTQNAAKEGEESQTQKNSSSRTSESLSSRLRKKSMLLAYDEGQLEIADDTTYRTLDIDTDFDLISQFSDPVEEYVSEIHTGLLKSPEENNNMSIKGSATSSSSKPPKTKTHSTASGNMGSSKRNSITSMPSRKTSGVSVASLDLEGKEQKGNWPKDKLQKLKKHISEGILGSTKHKEGRKSLSDIRSLRDHSFDGEDAASYLHRHTTGVDKLSRKDSGADISAKVDDSDKPQTHTPRVERRPSRRQRKLAMSPVENERLFTQFYKERTSSWSGSDDSGIHNNQSRSSTDVSMTEDDLNKEPSSVAGELDAPVVRRRKPRPLSHRPKSDITDMRWEDYAATGMGVPPTPPPRTVTRRPISDPLVTNDNELEEVVYREKRNSKPRPKSDHYGDYRLAMEEPPQSPLAPRYRQGSLAVIRDNDGEDDTSSGTSTPTPSLQNAPTENKSEKVAAGSRLRRSRRPRPMSDLGHINLQDIDNYVQQQQQRRFSGEKEKESQCVVVQQAAAVLGSSHEYIPRSVSTPTDLNELDTQILHTGIRLADEDSSSGEDITSPAYGSTAVQPRYQTYAGYKRDDDYDDTLTYAEALWDHVTMDEDELAFKAGNVIEVTDMMDKDWWWGRIQDKEGWFPASFVRLRVNQSDTVEECVAKIKDGTLSLTSQKMKKMSISFLSKDQVRANVINEILSTEKIYVKHLRDVCEGYVKQCHKRPEMFSREITEKIFSNIEEIYLFQNKFVKKLQSCINHEIPHLSEIGHCFLEHKTGFSIYSVYCNNHPSAMMVLKDLFENRKYRHFFEACRLLQEMIEISLDGFLLTPVQKICKYPLQLAELLKYTKPEHKDYIQLKEALEEMKNVASLINEQKRRLESVHTIAKWQLAIEGWEGEDVLEHSSMLVHSGEVTKISKGLGRAKVRQVFLFDHQMVLCKRDILNRNRFTYAGRVYIDQILLEDMDDGKDNTWGINVKNGFQLHNKLGDKWHIISVKSKDEKDIWIKAFNEERKLVREDRKNDFVIPAHVKKEAVEKALKEQQQQQQTSKKPKNVKRKISQMPFPRQLELLQQPQKSVTLPQGISSEDAFLALKDEQYKKRTWNIFGTIKRKR